MIQLRMLTVQVVTAVPTFVLVPVCVVYSCFGFAKLKGVHSILPAGLLLVKLQGLLGASAWPVAGLLAMVASCGVSERGQSKAKLHNQKVLSATFTVLSLVFLASLLNCVALWLAVWLSKLWLGALFMGVTNLLFVALIAFVTSDSVRWQFDASDNGAVANWTDYESQQHNELEIAWKSDSTEIHHRFDLIQEPFCFEYQVGGERYQMKQRNLHSGTDRKVRRLHEKHEVNVDKSTAGCAFTLVLALVWCLHVLWIWHYLPIDAPSRMSALDQDATTTWCSIASGIIMDGAETNDVGRVLDLKDLGYDFALFLALLVHRHRLIRRGEWSDGDDLNSDLSNLTERSFSLLPDTKFWNDTILHPVKQSFAVEIQKIAFLSTTKLKTFLSRAWLSSFALVLTAGSIGFLCVFDDIPVGLDATGTVQWINGCKTNNVKFLAGLTAFVVPGSIVGLVSWAATCDVSTIGTAKATDDPTDSTQCASKTTAAGSTDGYIPILCYQLLALPLVVALYFERTGLTASHISQSVTQRSAVPTSIVALGFGVFLLIIADRAVYMLESRTNKLVMLWCSLLAFCGYWVYDDSQSDTSSDSSWSLVHLFLMLVCSAYFYESAVQLEIKLKRTHGRRFTQYTKVPGDTKTLVHRIRWFIRKTPFLMELVYLVRKSLTNVDVTYLEIELTFGVT